jgi:hypothetical protein
VLRDDVSHSPESAAEPMYLACVDQQQQQQQTTTTTTNDFAIPILLAREINHVAGMHAQLKRSHVMLSRQRAEQRRLDLAHAEAVARPRHKTQTRLVVVDHVRQSQQMSSGRQCIVRRNVIAHDADVERYAALWRARRINVGQCWHRRGERLLHAIVTFVKEKLLYSTIENIEKWSVVRTLDC